MTLQTIREIRACSRFLKCNDVRAWKQELKNIALRENIDEKQVLRIYHARTADELLAAAEA